MSTYNLRGKTVLITGGTGSIGSEILSSVLERDVAKVIVFSRDEIKHSLLRQKHRVDKLVTIVGDIRDRESVESLFQLYNIDVVYHAAAMKHLSMCEESPLETTRTNIIGTHNVVESAYAHGVKKLITISTDKSVNPVNVMGSTKLIAERITLKRGYTCVRFGNVANSRGSVIPVFFNAVRSGKPLLVNNLDVTRFIIRLRDAANLVMKATELSCGNDVFILKMDAFSLSTLVEIFCDEYGATYVMRGLEPGERLHEDLIHETEYGNVYETDCFYVVIYSTESSQTHPFPMFSSDVRKYSSKNARQLTKSELLEIVKEHDTCICCNPRV